MQKMERLDSELKKTPKSIKNGLETKKLQQNEISNIFVKNPRFRLIFRDAKPGKSMIFVPESRAATHIPTKSGIFKKYPGFRVFSYRAQT